jgi:probable rRNA maturation factor
MSVAIEMAIEAGDWKQVPDAAATAERAARAALSCAGVTDGELAILLTDDAHIRTLNRQWRAKDMPTDVLSFPAPPAKGAGPRFLGDVALAFETLARDAQADGNPVDHHLAHLVVHGVLHLLGHDHQSEGQAQVMERQERMALARIGVPDPYTADTTPGARST